VDILWVHDAWRLRGVGSALMTAAEGAARAHGCRRIHLDTMSFQAPEFYRKLGYTVFGVLTGFPQDATRIYLVKDLAP
jgi:GNAT superfamily N-acetyltransferase